MTSRKNESRFERFFSWLQRKMCLTFINELKETIRMDKADIFFLITSFLYLVISVLGSMGLRPDPLIHGLAFIVLWGVYFITTFLKSRFYFTHSNRRSKNVAIFLASLIFILAVITIIINPNYY